MTNLNIALLQAAPAAGNMSMLIMMGVLFAVIYFFMIRPQNKRQKKIRDFQASLKIGDQVVTTAGIHGTIKKINDENNTITLNVATGVEICFDRAAIMPTQA